MASPASIEAVISAKLGLDSEVQQSGSGDGVDLLGGDADLAALLKELQGKFGSAIKAVLLYGSYTRGARDSLVDLYVLVDGFPGVLPAWHAWANKLLPPNVYQLEAENGVRCKFALMPLRQFVRRLDRDFHSYFWARFAQPCQLVYLSDSVSSATLVNGLASGARTFLNEAAAGMEPAIRIDATAPSPGVSLVEQGLSLTYRCELRAENGRRAADLVAANKPYFAALVDAWWQETARSVDPGRPRLGVANRWARRRLWGKVLSVARLVKAAFTFNDGFDYLLWKIERHSGIYIEPTPLQRRFPLLFGWPLFWRLYRLRAFS